MMVTVGVSEFAEALELSVLERGSGVIAVNNSDTNRPGVQFAGYFEHFAYERVQLIGNAEMHYLYNLADDAAATRMDSFMASGIPCVICSRGNRPPAALLEAAKNHGVPVFITQNATAKTGYQVTDYLTAKFAPHVVIHGVLLDVCGIGVLLTGESGIGKSETALELVKQGHRLVADDAVELTVGADGFLEGRAPEITRNLMEIRGIGLIDIRYLYGVGSVISVKPVELVINLELWRPDAKYERLGANDSYEEYLGIRVPSLCLPVRPGRNLAIVVEVAASNFRLVNSGYDATKEFTKRIHIGNDGERGREL